MIPEDSAPSSRSRAGSGRRSSLDAPRRLTLLAGVVAAVAGVSVAEAVLPSSSVPGASTPPASAILAGASASSSSWYCAAPAAAPAGSQATVLLTNLRSRPVRASLQTVSTTGASTEEQVTLPAYGSSGIPVPLSAVEVVLRGGEVSAAQQVTDSLGSSAAPCASAPSTNMYFGAGSTAGGAGMQVAVFNPLPTPAVVDVSFVSPSGLVVPPAYQGIPVSPGTVVTENVSDHVPSNGSLAAVVNALSGSVVATEMEEGGAPGALFSVVDGANQLGSVWSFAQNADPAGGGTTFTLVNPASGPVTVTASISLGQGRASPLVVQVPGQSSASFSSQNETRIPSGSVFGIVFRTLSGQGIFVGRQVSLPAGGPLPANSFGNAQLGGVSRWLVPAVLPGETVGSLGMVDLAGAPERVTIATFGSGTDSGRSHSNVVDRVTLVPGALVVLTPSTGFPLGSEPLVLHADGPVSVELDPSPAATPGSAPVPLWPLLLGES